MVGAKSSRSCYFSSQALYTICTILHHLRERGRAGVEEDEDEELKEEDGRKEFRVDGRVNRSLIRHIPSVDSCALLNKAFDTRCY